MKLNFFTKKEFTIFLIFFILYSYFVYWAGINENTRFFLTRAIVDEGRLEIDTYANQTADRAYINGHYYSEKAPGTSFLAIPVHATWKFIYYNLFPQSFKEKYSRLNEYVVSSQPNNIPIYTIVNPGFFILTSMVLIIIFVSSFFSALSIVLMYKITGYFTNIEKNRILLTSIFGLGTTIFPYALVFLGEGAGTFFLFLGFYLILKIKRENILDKKLILLTGLVVGFSFVVEYTTAIFIVFLTLMVVFSKNRKNFHFFLIGLFIGVLPLFIYNILIFGNPLEFTRSYIDPQIYPDIYRKDFGFFYGIKPFVILRLLFYPYRGLFYYYPILLLSFIGLFKMYKEYKVEVISIILSLFILAAINSSMFNWWGGAVFGPRHFSVLIPYLTLPLIYVIKDMRKINFLLFVLGLFLLISIFNNVIGLQYPEAELLEKGGYETAPNYKSLENTFAIMLDPIHSHYLPLFMKYGPRSRIFENLINGYIDIDIRVVPYARSHGYPYCCFPFFPENTFFYVPFLSILPILFLILLIFSKHIKNFFKLIRFESIDYKESKFTHLKDKGASFKMFERNTYVKTINTVLIIIILAVTIFILINYIFTAYINLNYQFDLQFDEGGFFINTLQLFEGKLSQLYHNAKEEPLFFTNDNPPVFYIITSFFFLIFGKTLIAGRFISILASFGVAYIIYKIIIKKTNDILISLTFSLIFFSSYITFYWAPICRPDFLALLFSLIGIYFILEYKKEKNILLAAIFFILSVYTRQTYIMAPVATFIYLCFKDRKYSFEFLDKFLLPSIAIFLILTIITNGQFFINVVSQNMLLYQYYTSSNWINILGLFFFPLTLCFIFIYNDRKDFFSIYFILVFTFAFIQSYKTGGWVQYFIELTSILVIPIALLYTKEKNGFFSSFILLLIIFHLFFMIYENDQLVLTVLEPEKYSAIRNLDSDKKLYQYIKDAKGNVLVEHRYLNYLTGKKLMPEIFELYELSSLKIISIDDVYTYLEKNNVTLIIYRSQLPDIEPLFTEYISKNYKLVDEITYIDYRPPPQTWKVYKRL
jgi:4-amino-4-deoxy-L-arabinose transferase-like glycosyltransferase